MKKIILLLLFLPSILFAQKKQKAGSDLIPPYTPAAQRMQSMDERMKLTETSLLSQVEFKNVGPTIMSGRVVDIAVNPDNTTEFYVAYASGGLWHTVNNGMSFTPVFDQQAVMTMGAIAVDWKRNVIWVGSGESNSSRSSYSGLGIFKSVDGGKTWNWSGLGESHHIGRIVLDETNTDVAFVAALGHLYSPNKERGIYKTSDGGKTWKQTLFVNDTTGCIDVTIDPNNKNVVYASAWDRQRHAWNFDGAGKGSGIYKSIDAGETWQPVTPGSNGFPQGEGVGRIGLATANNKGNTVIYAFLDNQFPREKKKEDSTKLTKEQLRTMTYPVFESLNKKKIEDFLKESGFPDKYTADTVLQLIKAGTITLQTLVDYLEDANSLLFDTNVIGAELYSSDDGGATWKRTHKDYMDDMFYTYGYYFANVRTVKNDPDKIYIIGFVIATSDDWGKTFRSINADNVHVDHHALWVDQEMKGHLVNGNDGGVNVTYDDGKTWIKCNNPPVGQFYSVNVDMEKPYNIFGGLQDNGVWYGPHATSNTNEWHQTGQYPYKEILDGDGMQIGIDTRGNNTVYTGFQFGNYFRVNILTNSAKYITPQHDLGQRPYRWNWQSPIQVSTHNQDIIYFGANKLFRSLNRGEDFKPISADLTHGGKKGNVPYGTLTAIHESPLHFGLIYTGSDDGLIYVTKDGGNTWTKISDKLPQRLWMSRVQASDFSEARVYASLNGYRWDDFNSYLYASDDYGATWTKIGNDLPSEPINVVKEDPSNENILYVGTDHGVYVSLDRGKSFMRMSKGLPAVPVHDLVIHPRDHDLVLGTHGRSFYVASVKEVQQLRDPILQKPLYVFETGRIRYNDSWGMKGFSWDSITGGKTEFPLYLSQSGKVTITIYADSVTAIRRLSYDGVKGLNYLTYDLSIDSMMLKPYEKWLNRDLKEGEKKTEVKRADNGNYYLRPGKYKYIVEANGVKEERILEITSPF